MRQGGRGGRVGWGIVGCGWVARDYVAPAIRAAQNGRLVALCDPDEVALRAIARDASSAARFRELDDLLACDGVDAVYVATPNHLHPEIVRAAAAAGKQVLCEKPMARTVAEAETMVAACERAGVQYATAFDQRFHAAHRRLRRLIADGELGTVTCIRIHYACWTPPEWAPDALSLDNWRADPERAGGGAMIDLAPHGLDLTQYLLDEPLTEIACLLQRRVFPYPVDDGATLIGRSASGVLLSHTVAYNRPDTFPRRVLEVIGDRGRALALNTMGQTPGGTLTLTDLSGEERRVQVAPHEDRSPFLNGIEAFGWSVLTGTPFPFAPEMDLHTTRLLEAAGEERIVRVEPTGGRGAEPLHTLQAALRS